MPRMLSLFALAALGCQAEALTPELYGSGSKGELVKIDSTSGRLVIEAPARPEELQGQELSTIDKHRGHYYIVGYNATSAKPNLYGWNLKTHEVVVDTELPLTESGFVGVGQAIDADPVTGDLFLVGRSNRELPNSTTHSVLRLHYNTSFKTDQRIVDIKGIDILDGSSAYDHIHGVEYLSMLATGSLQHPEFNIIAVNVHSGAVETIKMDATKGEYVQNLDFDSARGRMYGFGVDTATQKRSLTYLDTKTHKFTTVGDMPTLYSMEDGNLVTLDASNRVYYSLLAKSNAPNVTHWAHSDKCDSCTATGEECCYDPTQGPSSFTCFAVSNCSQITDGGGPPDLTAPVHLVGVHLETANVVHYTPDLCAIVTNGTYPACPWTIESLL